MQSRSASLFKKTEKYIGRQDVIDVIKEGFAQIRTIPICRALYIEDEGGAGKTFLLQKIPQLLESVDKQVRAAPIVDLSDSETHSNSVLEGQILAGLGASRKQPHLFSKREVDAAFQEYTDARTALDHERSRLPLAEIEARQRQLTDYFVRGLNALAARHPVILRFDTAEALQNVPPQTQLLGSEFPTSAANVVDWLERVLPQLRHVLVLFCSRPSDRVNLLYDVCQRLELLAAPKLELARLSKADIVAYFRAHDLELADEQELEHVSRITGGRPLLLSCLIQSRTIPQFMISQERTAQVVSPASFERFVVGVLLNPLTYLVREEMAKGQLRDFPPLALTYCLYVLAIARRGISKQQLTAFLRQHDYPIAHSTFTPSQAEHFKTLLADLDNMVLVKVRPNTNLLYLHEEVYDMIDQGGLSIALGIADEAMEYLIEQSRAELAAAADRTARFNAISNLIYYELTNDIDSGYRQYLLSMYRLFAINEVEHAVLLRDEFWRWLNVTVTGSEDTGNLRPAQPHREALKKESKLELVELERDDAVWLVKYYMGRNENPRAVDIGRTVRTRFAAALDEDDYFKVDLYSSLGRALTLHQDGDPAEELELLSEAAAVLNRPDLNQKFLRDRVDFFRGEVYNRLGYLLRTLYKYEDAGESYARSRDAYLAYKALGMTDFNVDEAIAQATINLIFTDTKRGNLDQAVRLAAELRSPKYRQQLSSDRWAIVLNINSIVSMHGADQLDQSLQYVLEAWDQVLNIANPRVRAQVAAQVGCVYSEQMNRVGVPDARPEQFFLDAERIFVDEPGSLRETLIEHGRYERRLGRMYRRAGRADLAQKHFLQSLDCFARAIDVIGTERPTVHLAELYVAQAVVYRLLPDIPETERLLDAADTILGACPPATYAQLVAGEVAFKRGQIAFERGQWPESIRLFALALAWCGAFSPENRTGNLFRKRIRETFDGLPQAVHDQLAPYVQQWEWLASVPVADLPYQQPDGEVWERSWQQAIAFLRAVGEPPVTAGRPL